MPLPAEGLSSIQEFVGSLNADMPPDMAGRMRYETRVYRNAVTLVEIAPLDFQTPGSREFEVPFARLRFTRSQGWELFWSDRNSARLRPRRADAGRHLVARGHQRRRHLHLLRIVVG